LAFGDPDLPLHSPPKLTNIPAPATSRRLPFDNPHSPPSAQAIGTRYTHTTRRHRAHIFGHHSESHDSLRWSIRAERSRCLGRHRRTRRPRRADIAPISCPARKSDTSCGSASPRASQRQPSAMAHGGLSTAQAGASGPKAAHAPSVQSESGQQREEWRSWWKNFKRSDKKAQEQHGTYTRNGAIPRPLHMWI